MLFESTIFSFISDYQVSQNLACVSLSVKQTSHHNRREWTEWGGVDWAVNRAELLVTGFIIVCLTISHAWCLLCILHWNCSVSLIFQIITTRFSVSAMRAFKPSLSCASIGQQMFWLLKMLSEPSVGSVENKQLVTNN